MKLLTHTEELFYSEAKWGMPGPGPAHDVQNTRSEVLFTHYDAKSKLTNLVSDYNIREKLFWMNKNKLKCYQ